MLPKAALLCSLARFCGSEAAAKAGWRKALRAFRRSQLHCPFRGQCNCSLAQLFALLRKAKSCAASFATLLTKALWALDRSSVSYRPEGPRKLSEALPRLLEVALRFGAAKLHLSAMLVRPKRRSLLGRAVAAQVLELSFAQLQNLRNVVRVESLLQGLRSSRGAGSCRET